MDVLGLLLIVAIAIPSPVRDVFEYLADGLPVDALEPGRRVRVDFANRPMIGVIVERRHSAEYDPEKLKPLEAVIDQQPVIPAPLLTLLQRLAQYYHHPLGEVIFTALPARLRQGKAADANDQQVWSAASDAPPETIASLARAPSQRDCLALLQRSDRPLSSAELRSQPDAPPNPSGLLKALRDKGLVTASRAALPPAGGADTPRQPGPTLNAEQQQAVDAIAASLDGFQTHLLDGVTGSGKTEVYLALIEQVLDNGGQILVVVPEISLTPQLERRFRQRLGARVATLHSGLNDSERLQAWRAASRNEVGVIIGTRSSVFTPFHALRLIIVDEEHDPSLKQQEGFRYHARDVAVLRAKLSDCPAVLGSATPSLETLHNARQGKFTHLRLRHRAGNARPPQIHLVDLRRQALTDGLSRFLIERIKQHLANGHQVMLFLNRRGYAPLLLCHSCGTPIDCPRCASHTVWHAHINELRCHICGFQSRPPAVCPACGEKELTAVGIGAQKLEQVVRSCFPNVPLIRVDRDSMTGKHDLSQALDAIAANRYQIIVGTQLLAKVHDFPNITLFGVIDADQGLFSVDFRSPERLAQQVIQVSGRAGRGDQAGEVILQSHQPDHPLLRQLLHQDYGNIAELQLAERAEVGWPPYSHLALIRASAVEPEKADSFLQEVAALARENPPDGIEILGPVASPLARKAGRYRFQLLLRCAKRGPLHRFLNHLMPAARKLKSARQARWSLDIDPADLS